MENQNTTFVSPNFHHANNSLNASEGSLGIVVMNGILINLASLCIEISLPVEKVSERLSAQTMLLLCASLQNHIKISKISNISKSSSMNTSLEETIIMNVYLTIILSLARCAAIIVFFSRTKRRWKLIFEKCTYYASFCSFLSLICSLILSITYLESKLFPFSLHEISKWFVVTFSISVLWTLRQFPLIKKKRNTCTGISFSGSQQSSFLQINGIMENNNSTANATSFVDEYNWYLWNSESFLKWLATKIQDPLQHDTIIDKLAPENLNGKCLQHLTLTDLRSFGLSYGDALLIKDEIIKLQSKYDGGSLRREEERYRQYKQESSLQFDIPTQQYDPSNQFHHETISQSHTYKSAQAPQQQQQIYNGGQSINEDVILKAKDVMSKRFGLSLPEPNIGMKTNYNYLHNNREEDLYQTKQQADHVSSSNQSKQSKLQRKNSLLSQNITTEPIKHGPKSVASHLKSDQFIMKAQMQYAATKDPPLATAGIQQQQNITEKTHHPIPKTIFDSMPPNIQNIVRRRPYLVEKVINAKKGEGGVQSDTTNDSTIPFHLLQGMPPNIQEIALRRPDLVKQLMSSKIANNHDNHASQSLQYGTNVPKTMPVKEPYDHSDEEHVHLLKEW